MNAAMQPTGTEVKREGLDQIRRSGKGAVQQGRVLRCLYWQAMGQGMTRNTLATLLEMPLSSVCGRCKELLDLDFIEPIGSEGKPARQVLGITEKGMDHLQSVHAITAEPDILEATQ